MLIAQVKNIKAQAKILKPQVKNDQSTNQNMLDYNVFKYKKNYLTGHGF